MNMIVTNASAKKNFYPTPETVIEKMLKYIDLSRVKTVLEPSAGSGNIIYGLGKVSDNTIDVDAVEIDPNLRGVLNRTFKSDYANELYAELMEINERKREKKESDEDLIRESEIRKEMKILKRINFRIVHDDFLTYHTHKKYDLIIMNPPFDKGDAHLLHAIELLGNGGQLCCLLNSETLNNPYSIKRQHLSNMLDQFNAKIIDMGICFQDSERPTGVSVSMVVLSRPTEVYQSDIWERLKTSKEYKEENIDPQDLTVSDFIEAKVRQFEMEVNAGISLLKEFWGMIPYLENDTDQYASPVLSVQVNGKSVDRGDTNQLLQAIRAKYWRNLLVNPKFMSKMTSEIRGKYTGMVDTLASYDFSVFNIKQIMFDIQKQLMDNIDDEIMKLFDKLSAQYSWYPECRNNIHYYNGWATNKAHKVNKKVIIPCSDVFSSWSGKFWAYRAFDLLSDIEKVLNYLMAAPETDMESLQRIVFDYEGKTSVRNIKCKYFTVSFFKKGTVHIKFDNLSALNRLNIFCSQKRGWLPPCYGKKTYESMQREEKEIVDVFHGDGTNGSGKDTYNDILNRKDYYLSGASVAVNLLEV